MFSVLIIRRDMKELILSHEHIRRHVITQQEVSCLQPNGRAFTRHHFCLHLDLGLLVSKTVRILTSVG